MDMEKHWDVHDLGAVLKVKEPTIRSWVLLRKIPFIRCGRLIRFRPSQIEEWLAKKSQKGG